MNTECKHLHTTPVTGTEGRFHCDDCNVCFGTPAAKEKPSQALTKKPNTKNPHHATAKTMRLNAEDKADAARLQAAKDQHDAEAAAKDVAIEMREFIRLAQVADEAVEAATAFSKRIKEDAAFRAKVEIVQNFFVHKKSHQKLIGENGAYATAPAWCKGELGMSYDYIARKLREFHLAQLRKLLPESNNEKSDDNLDDRDPDPDPVSDPDPAPKETPKKRETANREELQTANRLATESMSKASEFSVLASRYRDELNSLVKLYEELGDHIQPRKLLMYLKELPRRLAAYGNNFPVPQAETPLVTFTPFDGVYDNGDGDLNVKPLADGQEAGDGF